MKAESIKLLEGKIKELRKENTEIKEYFKKKLEKYERESKELKRKNKEYETTIGEELLKLRSETGIVSELRKLMSDIPISEGGTPSTFTSFAYVIKLLKEVDRKLEKLMLR